MIRIHLSAILGEKRLTQADLSRMTGIRAATVNELYHEMADRVSLDNLERICIALNISLTDLLEMVPDTEAKKD